MILRIVILICVLLGFGQARAVAQLFGLADSVREGSAIYPIPLIFWSPETRIGGGATVYFTRRSFDSDSLKRTSTVGVTGIYTQEKQTVAVWSFDRYWRGGAYRFNGGLSYSYYPDLFYGIGPLTPDSTQESFTSRSVSFSIGIQKRTARGWYVGGLLDIGYNHVVATEEGGLFDRTRIRGERPGATAGIGAMIVWDTRDHNIFPTVGHYRSFKVVPYHRLLGSSYDFVSVMLDFRQFMSVFGDHVIAGQVYAKLIAGHPPFYKMAMLGGSDIMRGYYPGRYRDRNLVAAQAEYRMPLFWRFGLAAFLGYGDVAPDLWKFKPSRLKYSTGLGLRFLLSRKSHSNIRIDLAYGKNSAYPAIAIGEAF